MEPTIPTSFIPKKPVDTGTVTSVHHSRSVGLLSLLTFVIVVGTGLAFGAVYLYEKQLTAQKSKLSQSISDARDGIGTEFVADMKRLDARIAGVKDLIKNHIVVTPIFEALQATTLRSVQYKDFGYSIKTDPATKVSTVVADLSGTAKNYATIALQSDAFATNSLIKNPVFSNLTVDDKTRTINFKLTFSVNMSDLSYQSFIDSRSKVIQPTEELPENNQVTP